MNTPQHSASSTATATVAAAPLSPADRQCVRDYADGAGSRSKREQIAAFIGTSVEARDHFFECLLAAE